MLNYKGQTDLQLGMGRDQNECVDDPPNVASTNRVTGGTILLKSGALEQKCLGLSLIG